MDGRSTRSGRLRSKLRRGGGRLPPTVVLAIAGALALIFVPLVAFGAGATQPALVAATLASLFCALLLFALPNPQPLPLTPDLVLQLGAFCALLVFCIWTTSPLSAPWAVQGWALVPGSGAASLDRFLTWVEVAKLCGLAAAYCSGVLLAGHRRWRDAFGKALLVLASIYTVLAILAYLIRPDRVLGVLKHVHIARFTGTFFSANTAGAVFGVFAVLAFARLLGSGRGRPWWRDLQIWNWRSLALTAVRAIAPTVLFWSALLLTGSRGALVSTGLASIVMLGLYFSVSPSLADGVLTSRHRFWFVPLIMAGLACGLAAVAYIGTSGGWSGGDASDRHGLYKMMILAALQRPWLGYGLGTFRTLNDHLAQASQITTSWSLAAGHDLYLQWWLEGGAIGSGLVLLVVGVALNAVVRKALIDRSTLSLGVLGMSIVLFLQNTLDFSLQVFGVGLFWSLLLGVGGAGLFHPKGQKAAAASDEETASLLVRSKARRAPELKPRSRSSSRARFS